MNRPKSQPLQLQKLFEMQPLGSPDAAPAPQGSILADRDPVEGTKSWETPRFVSSQRRVQPRQKRQRCSSMHPFLAGDEGWEMLSLLSLPQPHQRCPGTSVHAPAMPKAAPRAMLQHLDPLGQPRRTSCSRRWHDMK